MDEFNKIYKGLTAFEASQKLRIEGFNELNRSEKRNFLAVILSVVSEPMFILLISCSFIYLLIGDAGEAMMLIFSVFIVIGITLYQEGKTEKALNALRDLSSPRALVLRDGEIIRIAGNEVVTDDILLIQEGDRIAADGILLESMNLLTDESLLTGESFPVEKNIEMLMNGDKEGNLPSNRVYLGSMVVKGRGTVKVTHTAMNTRIGKIGKSLQSITSGKTNLQKETNSVVRFFFITGGLLCTLLVIGYGLESGKWIEGFLAGLTLAISLLPEEFPVVLTIFLSLGAYRLSRIQVLARKISTIETLGSATVICSDKTGTLTENKMSVAGMWILSDGAKVSLFDNSSGVSERNFSLLRSSSFASMTEPFDPMEKAILETADFKIGLNEIYQGHDLIKEYPLQSDFLCYANAWRKGDVTSIYAKGAIEDIISLCSLSETEKEKINQAVQKLAEAGLRILGTAVSENILNSPDSVSLKDSIKSYDFTFEGLIGFHDPVRTDVPEAVQACRTAGIRVLMITGDHIKTALSVARSIGMNTEGEVLAGKEMQLLSEDALYEKLKYISIISRVAPEQKLNIIAALKKMGHTVCMTGDGVNDAPALKAAHIGIAMGKRGTDVAREASDMVLLDDNFSSIVHAVRAGRRIYDNLKKAVSYILAVHVPMVGISLLPVVLGQPLIFFPVHIVFWELFIDPACSLVFEVEEEEKNVMNRPPRDKKDSLFRPILIIYSLLQGISVLGAGIFVYLWGYGEGLTTEQVRAMTFTSMVFGNLLLIISNRSYKENLLQNILRPNKFLYGISGVTLFLLILVLNNSFLLKLFYFEQIPLNMIILSAAAGTVSLMWFEVVKIFFKEKMN